MNRAISLTFILGKRVMGFGGIQIAAVASAQGAVALLEVSPAFQTISHFALSRELSTALAMKRNPRSPSSTVG
jgi:hypothetical protein